MTAMIPRRKRPTPGARLRTNLNAIPRLAEGQSKALRPVQRAALATMQAAGIFALIIHGDDPNVARPAVLFAYWVGAAAPANAEPYDWWYTADVDA